LRAASGARRRGRADDGARRDTPQPVTPVWVQLAFRMPSGGARRRRVSRAWATPWRPTARVRSSSTQSGRASRPVRSRSCTAPLRCVAFFMARVSPSPETVMPRAPCSGQVDGGKAAQPAPVRADASTVAVDLQAIVECLLAAQYSEDEIL